MLPQPLRKFSLLAAVGREINEGLSIKSLG